MVKLVRNNDCRKDSPSLGIIDSKSVKNSDLPEEKGYDAGKKVSGIKLHIATDSMGLPHAIHVTTADIQDRSGAIENNLNSIEKFLVDGGYSGEKFANTVSSLTGAKVEVSKRPKKHEFVLEYMRWIVERTFGWLDKFRRLAKNFERKKNSYKQMVSISLISILLRRF